MQALNLQLDLAPAAQLPGAHAGQGKTGVSQAESSFGRELDKAVAGSTDGQKQTTHTDSPRENRIAETDKQSEPQASQKVPEKTGQTDSANSIEKNSVETVGTEKKIDDAVEQLLAENAKEGTASAEAEPVFEIHIGQDTPVEADLESATVKTEPVEAETLEGNFAQADSAVLKDGAVQTVALNISGETTTAEKPEEGAGTNKKSRKVSVKETVEDPTLLAHSMSMAEQNVPDAQRISAQTATVVSETGSNAEKNQTPTISVSDLRTQPEGTLGAVNQMGTADGAAVTFTATGPLTEAAGKLGVPDGETRFTQLLSREIQNSAGELVKTGSIILRDNNVGTINLVLHPEELGNVKIRLELTDRLISGKITVASQEAFNAFKANIEVLRSAFAESGFETAAFDLSWSGSGGEGGSNDRHHEERNSQGLFYSELMPAAVGLSDEGNAGYYKLSSVNVMA